jgi:hypothetical protein
VCVLELVTNSHPTRRHCQKSRSEDGELTVCQRLELGARHVQVGGRNSSEIPWGSVRKRSPCLSGAGLGVPVIELKWRILRAWSFHSTTVEAHSDKPSPTSISMIHRSERSTCSGSKRMSKTHSDRLKEREAARERRCRRMAKRETAPAGLLSERLSWTARGDGQTTIP